MRQISTRCFLILTVTLAGAGVVHGQPAPADQGPRSRTPDGTLALVTGLGTPMGWAGLEATFDPIYWLSLGAGVGVGSAKAPQVAAMTRLRVPLTSLRPVRRSLTVGLGLSYGNITWPPACLFFPLECGRKTYTILWRNIELGVEHRSSAPTRPFVLRLYLGWAIPINPPGPKCRDRLTAYCADTASDTVLMAQMPYLGASFGFAFR